MSRAKTISRIPYLSLIAIADECAPDKPVTKSKANPFFVDYDEPYPSEALCLSETAGANKYSLAKPVTDGKTNPFFVDYDEPYPL